MMLHLDMKEILVLLFPAEEKSFRGLPFSGGPEINCFACTLFKGKERIMGSGKRKGKGINPA